MTNQVTSDSLSVWFAPGLFWFLVALVGAAVFFADGIDALFAAWSLPEYSHGPLIPILSGLLFLRQLKEYPVDPGPKRHRWVGVTVIVASLVLATMGKLSHISDLVAYATILWVGGILLVSFGWETGRHFWPPVLHLVYMLPLPGVIYFKMTTWLQFISSELGVTFLRMLSIPVFLDGNIIDLGVTKLHVAEACSGLRYLFPILSFSYIFAVLYKGPMWHKAVLLISAAPITVFMNSVRIAIAGIIVQYYGLDWLDGFTHFFEGWVIFIACILILFALARIMLFFNTARMSLAEALDLETDGLLAQTGRLRFIQPSHAMILAALLMVGAAVGWQVAVPERGTVAIPRESFAHFPRQLGDWRQEGPPRLLSPGVEQALAADDYRSVTLVRPDGAASVEFFSAWYSDQSQDGVHSPEICLPGGGWEIAWLERSDITEDLNWPRPFMINRAIIQKGESRMMVYYWFEQKGRKIAWDMAAKYWLLMDGIRTGRTDGALVRLTTVIRPDEPDAAADARLMDVLRNALPLLPRFIPEA
ncbi:MAG: VPLPA-CTERM-specific exosortase XrtD [Paracoccaceae bacterium]|nr:VPLPA-CTERM-specific exosortase XrtD [Paracoccaceae bacterium]